MMLDDFDPAMLASYSDETIRQLLAAADAWRSQNAGLIALVRGQLAQRKAIVAEVARRKDRDGA